MTNPSGRKTYKSKAKAEAARRKYGRIYKVKDGYRIRYPDSGVLTHTGKKYRYIDHTAKRW